jgi:hypothetical protein
MEDQLTPEERIRLEALAQANVLMQGRMIIVGDPVEQLVSAARKLADYITGED